MVIKYVKIFQKLYEKMHIVISMSLNYDFLMVKLLITLLNLYSENASL